MKKIRIITILLILLSITLPTFASAMEPLKLNYLSVILGLVIIISIILFNIFIKNKKKKIIINIILLILLTVSVANIIDWKHVQRYKKWSDEQEKHRQYILDNPIFPGDVEYAI